MARIRVEVVYALRDAQTLIELEVEAGTTALEAIRRSGVLERHPEISAVRGRVGVFGKRVELDAPLRDGDRVELYRPLLADPKEKRRQRAARRR